MPTSFISAPIPLQRAQLPVQSNATTHHSHRQNTCRAALTNKGKPKTVGIAGAGLAGLATALALVETPGTGVENVSIFEPRGSLDNGLGGPLNINGGAAVLVKCYGIDLWQYARRMDVVTAKDCNGSTLFEVEVAKFLKTNHLAAKSLSDGDHHLCMTIMRDQLQQLLFQAVQVDRVTVYRGPRYKVIDVLHRGGRPHFVLANGDETPSFDLVIGADGIRSNVRAFVAGKTTPPRYSGLRVQWAINPRGTSELARNTVEQWFGDGGYALRYAAGPDHSPTEALALTFREDQSVAENETYKDEARIREDFRTRMEQCDMPTGLRDAFADSTKFIETGVYFHTKLPSWSSRGNCVLVGDAAHAMPPFLGQGANQAIQDARALAVALSRIGIDTDGLGQALDQYEGIRKGPVEVIMESSRLVGNLETQQGPLGRALRNNLFRIAGITGAAGQAFTQAATPRVDMGR